MNLLNAIKSLFTSNKVYKVIELNMSAEAKLRCYTLRQFNEKYGRQYKSVKEAISTETYYRLWTAKSAKNYPKATIV
jgi:hypothetical protein